MKMDSAKKSSMSAECNWQIIKLPGHNLVGEDEDKISSNYVQ